jgi:hypothetical protein
MQSKKQTNTLKAGSFKQTIFSIFKRLFYPQEVEVFVEVRNNRIVRSYKLLRK